MLVGQATLETRLLLRNGEQLLLTIIIPTFLLVVLTTVPIVDIDSGRRIDFLTPGVLALAVMSTAFTGQAIATGYERRYGVLKWLGATPLPRWILLGGKIASVLLVEALQVTVLCVVAYALGWHPHGSPLAVAVLLVVGTGAFAGLGLLMAGTLPIDRFPDAVQPVLEALPITALSDGLRDVLQHGAAFPWASVGILAVWAAAACTAAALTFRWE
jgi:ABC-2 type transport system permease protein